MVRGILVFEESRAISAACWLVALFSIGCGILSFRKMRQSAVLSDEIAVMKKETAQIEAETGHLGAHLGAIREWNSHKLSQSFEESD